MPKDWILKVKGGASAHLQEEFTLSCSRGKGGCCCCCWVASVVSDSVRPHRQQPTRLPRPWDSPGKNSRAGCHFLLQCMKVKSESEVAQSCPTLSDPMDCSLPSLLCPWDFPGKSTGVGCQRWLAPPFGCLYISGGVLWMAVVWSLLCVQLRLLFSLKILSLFKSSQLSFKRLYEYNNCSLLKAVQVSNRYLENERWSSNETISPANQFI